MKYLIFLISLAWAGLCFGQSPRIAFGLIDKTYYPVLDFSEEGGTVEVSPEKTKIVSWDSIRFVPAGDSFSRPNLKVEIDYPHPFAKGSENVIKMKIKSWKERKGLSLIVFHRWNGYSYNKLPDLPPRQWVDLKIPHSNETLKFLFFEENQEVNSTLRKPMRQGETKYEFEGKGDRFPVPVVTVEPINAGNYETQTSMVKVLVNEYGLVADAEVLEASSPQMAKNSLKASYQWVFSPRVKDSKRVPFRTEIPFKITLHKVKLPNEK